MYKGLGKLQELEKLAEPLHKWCKENCNPYGCIIINYEGVKVLQEQYGFIIHESEGENNDCN